MGTDGFEFVEYTAPDPQLLRSLFERLGFPVVAQHRSKNVTLHSQGDINFVINAEPGSFGQRFAQAHGPSVCAMAFRVKDAAAAFERAIQLGAEPHRAQVGPMELNIPAIVGIGGSLIYFVDRYGDRSIYDVDFKPVEVAAAGERRARADRSPHAQRAPRQHGQVVRVLRAAVQFPRDPLFRYRREEDRPVLAGAVPAPAARSASPSTNRRTTSRRSKNTCASIAARASSTSRCPPTTSIARVDVLRARGVAFQDTPETYYEGIDARVAGHRENLEELRRRRILIDGNGATDEGVLLQIFTANVIGPIFFEIIQRKGNQGFGEGNFKALFESIELDQIRRGVI